MSMPYMITNSSRMLGAAHRPKESVLTDQAHGRERCWTLRVMGKPVKKKDRGLICLHVWLRRAPCPPAEGLLQHLQLLHLPWWHHLQPVLAAYPAVCLHVPAPACKMTHLMRSRSLEGAIVLTEHCSICMTASEHALLRMRGLATSMLSRQQKTHQETCREGSS